MTSYPAQVENANTHEAFAASLRFNILACRRLAASDTYTSDNLSAPFNRLYIIHEGHVLIQHGETSWKFGAGDICLIPLNTAFTCRYSNNLKKIYLHFRLEFIPGHDVFDALQTCHKLTHNAQNAHSSQLIDYFNNETPFSYVASKAQILSQLSEFLHTHDLTPHGEREVYRKYKTVFETIARSGSYNQSVSKLAADMHMSISNFSRCFRKDTGMSPKAYLNKRLVEQAQYRLLADSHPIGGIAHDLSFEDEHYFSRFFKKHSGVSPKKYRELHQGIL